MYGPCILCNTLFWIQLGNDSTFFVFINSILGIQMPLVPTIFANVSILCMFTYLHARLKCLHSVVAFRVTSQIFFVLFKSVTHPCHHRVYALLERYRDHSYLHLLCVRELLPAVVKYPSILVSSRLMGQHRQLTKEYNEIAVGIIRRSTSFRVSTMHSFIM